MCNEKEKNLKQIRKIDLNQLERERPKKDDKNKTMYQKAESGEILWKEFYNDKARKRGYKDWNNFMDNVENKSRFMKSSKVTT